jgi:hypothetical protein
LLVVVSCRPPAVDRVPANETVGTGGSTPADYALTTHTDAGWPEPPPEGPRLYYWPLAAQVSARGAEAFKCLSSSVDELVVVVRSALRNPDAVGASVGELELLATRPAVSFSTHQCVALALATITTPRGTRPVRFTFTLYRAVAEGRRVRFSPTIARRWVESALGQCREVVSFDERDHFVAVKWP